MALTVSNQILLQFAINGVEIPVGLSSFKEISMICNIQNKLPTLHFVIEDATNVIHDQAQLGDGATIDVVLHSDYGFDQGKIEQVTFIASGTEMELTGASLTFTASGIFKAVEYLGKTAEKPIKGTSSDVISQLAQQGGLTANSSESTSDSQVWRPLRQTISEFAHHVCDHGYSGDSSIMSMGVTFGGQLIYKDIQKLATQSSNTVVMTGSPDMITQGIIPCTGFKAVSIAGLANFTQNYGVKLVQEKLDGTAQDFSSYAATFFSSFMNINSGIKNLVGAVRSEYLPHEMKNVHDKFYDAEYQNRRGRSLFTNKIIFTTANSSGLELYDVVYFQPILPTNNQVSDMLSGNYIVTAKKKYLAQGKYFESIEINSQGYGTNTGGLVGSDSGGGNSF